MAKQQTALTIPAPSALTAPLGLEGVKESEDLIIPRIRVVQPTSKMSDKAGTFHNNVTETTKLEVQCIFLRLSRTRVYWDPDDLTAPPLCASNDAEEPRSEFKENTWIPESGKCDDCVNSKWHANGDKPACALGYTFLGVDLDEGMPFFINLSRTSARTAKQIITSFLLRKEALFSRPVILRTEVMEDKRGKWYVVRQETGEALPPKSHAAAMAWFETLAGVEIAPDLSQEAPEAEEEIPF